jgi:hypothetical protein
MSIQVPVALYLGASRGLSLKKSNRRSVETAAGANDAGVAVSMGSSNTGRKTIPAATGA